ncbi:MAG: hypothetical protein AB7O88_04780 [Reyranellaceae bacterium]
MRDLTAPARRLSRAILPCMTALAVALGAGVAPSLAVPWQEQGGQTIVWLTDDQVKAVKSGRAITLDPDSTGYGGYCYGPLRVLGYAVAHNGARLTVANCSRSANRKDCSNLAGTWRNMTPLGQSNWALRALGGGRYEARESGMGNATGTAVLSGTTLTIDFRTGNVAGRYQWTLDTQCTAGQGTLVFTAGLQGQHATSINRQ